MPMPAKFSDIEKEILQAWKDRDIFKKTLAKTKDGERFVFFEGPPTANGMPHMGHVETRAFKDIIPRYKTMRGFYVERKAGWDTQGLPVEIGIEKELGISGKKDIEKYGIAEFNAKAKESVWKYKELWEKMSERIGYWLDFDHPYITYTNDYIETLWWIFKQAWDQDLLKQDYKVVPYCPRCGTALSSHEVAQGYQSVTEPAVFVKFELVDEPGTFVLAWTTTPWTLPGNVALAVDKKIQYSKIKVGNEQLILASALVEKVIGAEASVAGSVTGADLVGKKYKPLFGWLDLRSVTPTPPARPPLNKGGADKAYSIVPADFVTTEDGTGVVHTAVMYGEDDFNLGKKIGLPTVHTVDEQGKFNELVKPWVGREVKDEKGETQAEIIKWLEENGKLYKAEDYTHDYPFCWRCKHPLLYYAKTSWFILMSKLRDELIKKNEQVNWYPAHIKDGRFGEWLREVKDWAISRERYWGTPLPIWMCDNPDCKAQECLGSYAELASHVSSKNEYVFVRHGQSKNNVEEFINADVAQKDISPLTSVGKEQAEMAAKSLAGESFDVIFSSQFLRARQTADVIAEKLKLTVTEDARLNEFHIGDAYEGKSYAEYHRDYPTSDRTLRFSKASANGETWLDVWHRFFNFLQEMEKKHSGKRILIVTHADPIMIVQWATSLNPQSMIPEEYPANGTPIPVHFPAALFKADGTFDPHRPYVDAITWPCAKCKQGTMKRTPEVADTWYDSGSMPFAQWHYPFENKERVDEKLSYPADYISEAIDQTRGWFYTLLAVSAILSKAKVVKEPPYKNVVVLGHIRDAKGKKLSKSEGNYIDPTALIDEVGGDPIRFYLFTMNQPGEPKNFDRKGLDEVIKKTFLILMNVVSFWKLYPQNSKADIAQAKHPMDIWVVSRLNTLVGNVTERLEQYDITGAGRALAEFVTEISTWYVRRSRARMKSEESAMVSAILEHVLQTTAKLFAPFTPFLAEYVYRETNGPLESVHLEDWPTAGPINEQILRDMNKLREVVETGLALRAQAKIKIRQPLQQYVVTATLADSMHEILQDELNVKEIHDDAKLPEGDEWVKTETAALDTTISDELKAEGMLRDLVREFNALRKEAKLQPSDEIVAFIPAHTTAAKVVETYAQEFLKDVRAKAATPSLDGATHLSKITLDGAEIEIGLAQA